MRDSMDKQKVGGSGPFGRVVATVRLRADEAARLEELANARDLPKSALLRQAVRVYLAAEEQKP
jgi:predicted transcriptional regulator